MRSKQKRMTYEELNRMIEANKPFLAEYCGEQFRIPYRNLHGIKLPFTVMQHIIGDHADLSETDFTLSDLSNSCFDYANFCKTRAKGANFSNCSLESTDFRYAYMPGASFYRAKIGHAKFKHADLARVDFTNSTIYDTNFIDCNVTCSSACFEGASLENVCFDCSEQFRDTWGNEGVLAEHLREARKLCNVSYIGSNKKVQILEK